MRHIGLCCLAKHLRGQVQRGPSCVRSAVLSVVLRYTVGKITPEKLREIRSSDFKAQMSQRFPPNGSSTTPPHRSHDFKWKDYCPMVFRCAQPRSLCSSSTQRPLTQLFVQSSFALESDSIAMMHGLLWKPA